LDLALAILQGEPIADFQFAVNSAQASSPRSYVQGVNQLRDRMVKIVACPDLYRQNHFYSFVTPFSDLSIHKSPKRFALVRLIARTSDSTSARVFFEISRWVEWT